MRYNGYLIDLDGTMYRGTERIDAAETFIRELNTRGIPYLFVTNNSTRTPEQVAEKLNEFDIPATKEQIFTTSMATANFVYDFKKDAKVYFIGEEGLEDALRKKGFTFAKEDADVVIVGLDRHVTYEKFAVACLAIRNGAKFISTNGDIALPSERGFLPGNGSLTALVRVSTQVDPVFIGKPEPIITEQALNVIGTKKEETLMVGDNYETDILAGMRAGIDTLLVHTGVTTKEQLAKYDKQPTYTVESLSEWTFI
ncbi:TIGR01457 family HAD-type hydrolase [Fervidibacillus halotolerans]|uniref:TIGR01457 family HAD-type hydrolase n=1 Tax=Fervidibacillus halotolerans TaxID=2980027 RepID=A0A9E8RWL7_9BACI|nr:TIGR01457 family HAD-type hydrolase [Fervidibacillus halotolerans]WAA11895.1 TIGR01457 family HAD-type hydrolase [Fervidibacillus halotolerans]